MRGSSYERRKFLQMAGVFMVAAGCSPEKLFGPCPADEPVIPSIPKGHDVYISSGDLDALLPNPTEESLAIHLSGAFTTKGRSFATHNLGKNWTVDGDAEIALQDVTDMGGQPYYCLTGNASSVSGLTLRGNHSKPSGARRTGGVLLYGDGQIDGVTFRDFGSSGSETFVALITDSPGPASITNCLFTDFNPTTSDTQVTVYFIAGDRKQVLMEGNETRANGGWVQGHTIYQARKGLVRNNRTYGARIGYYGDYFSTRGITIEGNKFIGCEYGVQLQLSPTSEIADPGYFSHEDYTIGRNEIESSGANVKLDTLGPSTATRFIRGIAVDASLTLENYGATNVTRSASCRAA